VYNKLNFYFSYFHIYSFNLGNFKEEVLFAFNNNDPVYKYDFQIDKKYYLHLFQANGIIINKIPFILLSLNDDEDIIEDLFLDLLPSIDKYLKSLEEKEIPVFPSYIGIYISIYSEDKINPKELAFIKDKYLNNRS
jgi:hypothetical protein